MTLEQISFLAFGILAGASAMYLFCVLRRQKTDRLNDQRVEQSWKQWRDIAAKQKDSD